MKKGSTDKVTVRFQVTLRNYTNIRDSLLRKNETSSNKYSKTRFSYNLGNNTYFVGNGISPNFKFFS